MIQLMVGCNTATDHLMALVGREAVEEIQPVMGHSQPAVNVPFLTGRELTILKFSETLALAELVTTKIETLDHQLIPSRDGWKRLSHQRSHSDGPVIVNE
jgi:hypothetical protein